MSHDLKKPYRETVPVKVTDTGGPLGEEHEHPAFGMVSVGHPSGKPGRFFGSALEDVQHYVDITVYEASMHHHLGRNWYHAGRELLSVRLTPVQFAEILTTNMHGGVPCTIDHVGGQPRPAIAPDHETEQARIRSKFEEEVREKVAQLGELEKKVSEVLAKKNINQGDREQIRGLVHDFARLFDDHAPFMVESFQEAAEKVVVGAKAEVEAFVSSRIQQAGLEAIAAGEAPKLLGPKKEG